MDRDLSSHQRQWLVMLILFVVSLTLRWPYRSELAYHWDGAQFALAVLDYDLAAGQPHAPGFPLYVLAGKLVNLVVGNPHAALVWLSLVAGSLLPALVFRLGTRINGYLTGLGAALIVMASPLCWFHSEVALTTIVDAALVTGLMCVCWPLAQGNATNRRVIAACALFLAIAGVRLQSAAALTPFWLWVTWRVGPGKRSWLMVAILIAPLAWVLAHLDLILLKAAFDRPKTLLGGGAVNSIRTIAWSVWIGLLAAIPLVILGIRRAPSFLWWWLAPMLAFGVVAYTTMPGYVLAYLPALAVLAGLGLGRLRRPIPLLATVVALNTVIFVGTDYGMTAQTLARQQLALADCLARIRSDYPPAETVIEHQTQHFHFGFRQFQYHLPEYRNVLATPDPCLPGERGHQVWIGQHRVTTFADQPPTARHQLVVDPFQQTVHEH